MSKYQPQIAFYTYNLHGGGAERIYVNLMQDFVKRGINVDLVLNSVSGPYLSQVPPEVRITDLKAKLPFKNGILPLIRYLRKERPSVLMATVHPHVEVALLAKLLAFTSTRVFVREDNTLSLHSAKATDKLRWIPYFSKFLYPLVADGIVAISQGVAQDVMQITGLDQQRVSVIYNPAITSSIWEKSQEPLNHPWFQPGEPPIVLGVGRLKLQKDFPTLIKAFALVKQVHRCRLVILGQGDEADKLKNLITELGLEDDVAMLGFAENPYAYMAKASVFVLSSAWEGFGNVVVEALAVGTPVVSTNCQSGPGEILDYGKYGHLVPVGNYKEMAVAISSVLSGDFKTVDADWLQKFTIETVAQQYLDVLGIGAVEN
ncbi:glycosyltransferase [Anabaena subtropica]|uniref:Glycosyltransferase n=1 Tax=Anabaena subtropica FACHB-260 TaxID=2692884 RepID=A0ABR8CQY9_9NOST|nr:glycosyltransferase [Anabaena subtropica]MBD2345349.1 glycosyltransferase [Anabaena subtropica FACHB-260]